MADPKGFLNTPRELPKRRPVDVRIKDWKEVYQEQDFSQLQKQAGRCRIVESHFVIKAVHSEI
jgi:glutamate synthase (NADPH/NADH) small chain